MFCVFMRIALNNSIFPTRFPTINRYKQRALRQNWWFVIVFLWRKDWLYWCALGFNIKNKPLQMADFEKVSSRIICLDRLSEATERCVYRESTTHMCAVGIHVAHSWASFNSFLKCPFSGDFSDHRILLVPPSPPSVQHGHFSLPHCPVLAPTVM